MTKQKDRDGDGDLPNSGVPIVYDFWTPLTLDQLAKAQSVGPLDVDAVLGTWPGDDDDGFEEAVDELRRSGLKKDVPASPQFSGEPSAENGR